MKRTVQVVLPVTALAVMVVLAGCPMDPGAETPGAEEEPLEEELEEEIETIPPPENLMGTIALNNGKSAVMYLQVGSSSGNVSAAPGARSPTVSTPRATVGVTGTVRYDGDDYVIGGLYDDETGELDIIAENTAGQRFVFSGTYTPGEGFSGTVVLYDSDLTTVITQGSVSTAEVSDSDRGSIQIFTGTFGGDYWGTWNGTLTSDSFNGTYAYYGDSQPAGSVFGTRSGNTITITEIREGGTSSSANAGGSVNGSNINGWWNSSWTNGTVTEYYNGTWSGAEVDTNYDAPAPTNTDDDLYLANLIQQAIENGISRWMSELEDGNINWGDTYNSITGSQQDYDGDSNDEYVYTFGGALAYSDMQTGLSLSGTVLLEFQDIDGNIIHMSFDSDVSDFGSTPLTDDGGLTITYEDATSDDLFVDAEVNYNNETINEVHSASPIWELSGTDVASDVEALLF